MKAHLDADVIVYRAGFAAEHTFWNLEWDGLEREFESRKDLNAFMEEEGLTSPPCVITSRREAEPVEHALFNARSIVRAISEKVQADDVLLYLSGPTNFRIGLAKTLPYKGNRDPDHKPVHASDIKAMLYKEFPVVTSDGQEADDDIATAHYTEWMRDPYSSIICTIDKDLDMVPGLHYNFVKDEQYYVEPLEGLWWFYRQCLTGDTTDNIPGIRGIGPQRAAKVLPPIGASEEDLFRSVLEQYEVAYGDGARDRLLETGRLLWMRRQPDEFWNLPEDLSADTRST